MNLRVSSSKGKSGSAGGIIKLMYSGCLESRFRSRRTWLATISAFTFLDTFCWFSACTCMIFSTAKPLIVIGIYFLVSLTISKYLKSFSGSSGAAALDCLCFLSLFSSFSFLGPLRRLLFRSGRSRSDLSRVPSIVNI